MLTTTVIAIASRDVIRSVVLAAVEDHVEEHEGKSLGSAFAPMDGVGARGAPAAGIAARLSWAQMSAMIVILALIAAGLSLRTV